MKKINLSIIITAHNEGSLLMRTATSVFEATSNLDKITYEVIIHLDNPDTATAKTAKEIARNYDAIILQNNFGDISASRNYAVKHSNGNILALLDGDDLISSNWLLDGYAKASSKRNTIFHPEYNITFGAAEANVIWRMRSSFSYNKDYLMLMTKNRWCSTIIASKNLLEKYPYNTTKNKSGYEDWQFNISTRLDGIKHEIIDDTAVFYRIKSESLFKEQASGGTFLDVCQKYSFSEVKQVARSVESINAASNNPNFSVLGRIVARIRFLSLKYLPIGGEKPFKKLPAAIKEYWAAAERIDASARPCGKYQIYSSEQDYLGRIYCNIISNLPSRPGSLASSADLADKFNAIFIDFSHYTSNLPKCDNEYLLMFFLTQNQIKTVYCAKGDELYSYLLRYREFLKQHGCKIVEVKE